MTDKTTFPFWYKDWLDSPKIYSDILDSWWSNVSASSPETTQNLYQKMMNQGKTYYFLSEQFSQLLQGISGINQATDDWQKYLAEQFESIKQIYSDPHGGMSETMQGMFGAWQLLPMDTLHRTFSSSSLGRFSLISLFCCDLFCLGFTCGYIGFFPAFFPSFYRQATTSNHIT